MKSQRKFVEITGEYEAKTRACKQSGTHGTFDEIDETKCGRTSPAMQYMHCYLKENPSLITTAISLLPDGTFCQSSSGAPPAANARGNGNGRNGGRAGGNGRTGSTAADGVFESITSKNACIEQLKYIEMHSNLQAQKKQAQTDKRKALGELSVRFGNRNTAKESIKRYKDLKSNDTDDDSSTASIDGITESQHEIIEDYVEAEDSMTLLDKHLENNKGHMERFLTKWLKSTPKLTPLPTPSSPWPSLTWCSRLPTTSS